MCVRANLWDCLILPQILVVFKSPTPKIDFVDFLQIQAAVWKTNYTTFSYLLIPIYGQDMSENDFLTAAAKFRFCSIFTDICVFFPAVFWVLTQHSFPVNSCFLSNYIPFSYMALDVTNDNLVITSKLFATSGTSQSYHVSYIEEKHCVTTLKTAAKLMTKVGYIVRVFFLHGYLWDTLFSLVYLRACESRGTYHL